MGSPPIRPLPTTLHPQNVHPVPTLLVSHQLANSQTPRRLAFPGPTPQHPLSLGPSTTLSILKTPSFGGPAAVSPYLWLSRAPSTGSRVLDLQSSSKDFPKKCSARGDRTLPPPLSGRPSHVPLSPPTFRFLRSSRPVPSSAPLGPPLPRGTGHHQRHFPLPDPQAASKERSSPEGYRSRGTAVRKLNLLMATGRRKTSQPSCWPWSPAQPRLNRFTRVGLGAGLPGQEKT